MPVLDGIDSTKEIIKIIKEKEDIITTIVACTAFQDNKTKLRCLNAGMKQIFYKPLNFDLLQETF